MLSRLTPLIVAAGALLVLPAAADAHTLTYSKARAASQARGDALANQRVTVNVVQRISAHSYYTQVRWQRVDPVGCKGCVYDEASGELRDGPSTSFCSAEIRVRFRSSRSRTTRAAVQSQSCF